MQKICLMHGRSWNLVVHFGRLLYVASKPNFTFQLQRSKPEDRAKMNYFLYAHQNPESYT